MKRLLSTTLYVAAIIVAFVGISLTTAPAQGAPPQDAAPVEEMDLDLLREKLLKIWIIEESSDRHNQRRIAEKSFKGFTPYEPTGDAEKDAENLAEIRKNDKHLRHFLTLEMDNSIEVIDICKRVLGLHVKAPSTNKAIQELLAQELPEIKWRNKELGAALQDLGRRIGKTVHFKGLAKNEEAHIDVEFPAGFTLGQAIEFIREWHPMKFEYKDGELFFTYTGV